VEQYGRAHREALEKTGYLGLWHEPGQGIYHDVSRVLPDTHRGGAEAIASGYHQHQKAIFNMDRGETMYMQPEGRREERSTRKAVKSLRRQAPQRRISDMSTSQLGAAIRNRRPV
jgi:hypothetical protein